MWILLRSKKPSTDELKKVHKEEFSAAFQKMYDHAKACIYANGTYFVEGGGGHVSSSHLIDLKKKISPKTFGMHCV